jgi:hypothetical protein
VREEAGEGLERETAAEIGGEGRGQERGRERFDVMRQLVQQPDWRKDETGRGGGGGERGKRAKRAVLRKWSPGGGGRGIALFFVFHTSHILCM